MPIDFDHMFAQLGQPQKPKEVEQQERTDAVKQLMHDVIGRHTEYFSDPNNRLEFIKGQTADSFLQLSRYINAKLRGEKPHHLNSQPQEMLGAGLPMMHTPSGQDKPAAFASGFTAIQEYLANTEDSIEEQIAGAAKATEALIIWVHPFVDGNGRTSRFLAKLIEDGAVDSEELVKQTVSSADRKTYYKHRYATKEGKLEDANNEDLILDNDEREEMRVAADKLPTDIQAMYANIKRLLEDKTIQAASVTTR